MLRNRFRKFLPSHEAVKSNRHVARLGPWLQHHNLWHLHRRSVAGGVAAGLFAGLIPGSNPVQFTAAALLAIAGRVNLPIAVVVTLYSNPFTIIPLYYCAFLLGQLVMFQGGGALPVFPHHLQNTPFLEWLPAAFEWVATAGKPLVIGIPLLALSLAVVGYFVVDWTWRIAVRMAWARRCKRRKMAAKTPSRED